MSRYLFPGTKAQGSVLFAGNPIAAETVTVGDRVYTFVASGTAAFTVVIGSGGDDTALNFRDAVNKSGEGPSVGITAELDDEDPSLVRLFGSSIGEKANIDISEAATNVTVSAAKLTNGREKEIIIRESLVYTVLAHDITAANIVVKLAIADPDFIAVQAWSTTGLKRENITDLVTVLDDKLKIKIDGGTNLIAGDKLRIVAEKKQPA